MIADVGEAEPRWHPEGAGAGCEYGGLADTESSPGANHRTRLKARRQAEIDIGIVTNSVANGLIEPQHSIHFVLSGGGRRARERNDRRRVVIDEHAWGEKAAIGHRRS